MRPGELLALKWEDVDLDRDVCSVKPRSLRRRVRYAEDDAEPQQDRPQRRKHRGPQEPPQAPAGGAHEARRALAGSRPGLPLQRGHAALSPQRRALVQGAAEARRVCPTTIRLYDLRHTCATLLLCRNVHPKYVQELLGHASIAQTLDTYSHVLPGMDGGTARRWRTLWDRSSAVAATLLQRAPARRRGSLMPSSAYLQRIWK